MAKGRDKFYCNGNTPISMSFRFENVVISIACQIGKSYEQRKKEEIKIKIEQTNKKTMHAW